MHSTIRLFIVIFLLCFPGGTSWAQASGFLTISPDGSDETIALTIGNVATHKAFFLDNPPRLVVDAPLESVPPLPTSIRSNVVNNVRAAWFDTDTVRIVFDLRTSATLVNKTFEDGVLMLQLRSKSAQKPSQPAAPEKPLVIIDPGHGGEDPGAIGDRKSQEKDIVLAFAKALESSLLASGRYRVKLTRTQDIFIPLRERVNIARKAGGAIFISLHADSAPNDQARGLSVYTLSEKASDAEAEALAAHENRADILGGLDLSHEREDVADILISLAQRETRNQSALLADVLVTSLVKRVTLLPNTHRFAGFAVLKAPDIPSVLVETGFISHPQEEKLLKSQDYRQRLIAGLSEGIDRYFAKQKTGQQ